MRKVIQMIEVIVIAAVIYFVIQVFAKLKDSDAKGKTDGQGREDVPADEENGSDLEVARFMKDFEEHMEYMNREKPELKRSVRKILSLLEREGIPVKYAGKVIPQCFDSVEVYFTVSFGLASVKYHIEFTDQPEGGSWQLYAGVCVNGKKYRTLLPYGEKATYDQDELAWDYHVLESEAVKVIKETVGLNSDQLRAVPVGEAEIEFNVAEDMEIAFDYLYSEEHFPRVPWEYCDYEEFDPESRWKYVRNRYYDYL